MVRRALLILRNLRQDVPGSIGICVARVTITVVYLTAVLFFAETYASPFIR